MRLNATGIGDQESRSRKVKRDISHIQFDGNLASPACILRIANFTAGTLSEAKRITNTQFQVLHILAAYRNDVRGLRLFVSVDPNPISAPCAFAEGS
jgi:hypothetical protein